MGGRCEDGRKDTEVRREKERERMSERELYRERDEKEEDLANIFISVSF